MQLVRCLHVVRYLDLADWRENLSQPNTCRPVQHLKFSGAQTTVKFVSIVFANITKIFH